MFNKFAIGFGASSLALMALGLLVFRLEWLSFRPAFSMFGLGLAGCALAALLGLTGVIIQLTKGGEFSGQLMGISLLCLVPLMAVVFFVGPAGLKAPMIHDISTDTQNPPRFTYALAERAPEENSLNYAEEQLAELQLAAYPNIKPLAVAAPEQKAFAVVKEVVAAMGWQVLGESENPMTLEAVASTALMGFKDDIVIRVAAAERGTIIDVRSVSRLGKGDLGANARRIETLLLEMADRLPGVRATDRNLPVKNLP